ncbi:hypothetical protein EJB05_05312, partial [Eragrostis curvula]
MRPAARGGGGRPGPRTPPRAAVSCPALRSAVAAPRLALLASREGEGGEALEYPLWLGFKVKPVKKLWKTPILRFSTRPFGFPGSRLVVGGMRRTARPHKRHIPSTLIAWCTELCLRSFPVFSLAQPEDPSMSPCDPLVLARMAPYCDLDNLETPPELCCQMVVAAVGIGYGEEVPCLCLVAQEMDFLATGLDIDAVIKMYPVCQGILPVDSHTGDACKGINREHPSP